VTGAFSASEYLFQQIKLELPYEAQSMIVRPMETQGLLAKGALAAGIEEFKSIKTTTLAEPPAPGQGGASPPFYLTESFMLQIPHETNSNFHRESISCHGDHEPDG
jgi:hypothetical protein